MRGGFGLGWVRRAGAVIAALLVTAPGVAQAAPRTEITIAVSQSAQTLHPAIDNLTVKHYVLGAMHRRLFLFDPDANHVCGLCTQYPTVENGLVRDEKRADGTIGLAVTIKLPPDAKWGDGTPMTAKDIAFSHKAGRHPTNGYFNQTVYTSDVTGVTVVDDKTAVLHRAKKSCALHELSDFFILPAHIEEPIFNANPDDYRNRTAYLTAPLTPGLWAGPYRPSKIDPGSFIALEPNPNWWGRKPHFQRVLIRSIENTASLESALLSGSVDLVPGEIGNLSVEQLLSLEKRLKGRANIVWQNSLVYEHVDFNHDNPIFADLRVRQALLMGIDRDTILQRVFAGRYPAAHQWFSVQDPMYQSGFKTYPFDAAQAKALLDAAGWKVGPDGIRQNAKGERLSLEFMTTSGNRVRELVQQAMQNQWRDIGVETRLKNEPARVLFGQTARERRFTGLMMYAWTTSPAQVPRTFLHSTATPSAANGFAGLNFGGYKDPEMDRVIEAIEGTCAPEPRKQRYADLQRLYAERLPAIPLYYRADGFVIPTWLTGLRPTGHQFGTTNWIEEWAAK